MRWQWRQLHAGEVDHELVWLAVSLLSVGAMAGWIALGLPWPQCMFRALFRIPCLTCGATRAALAFLHLDLLGAWHFNPLATLSYIAIAIFDVYAALVLASGLPRLRLSLRPGTSRRAVSFSVVCLLLVNWAYLLRHG
jgi:hypothetical protein